MTRLLHYVIPPPTTGSGASMCKKSRWEFSPLAPNKLIQQAEETLASSETLDINLARELVALAKALEIALIEMSRVNLELRAMDRNVAAAANTLRDATDALNRAYTQEVIVDEDQLAHTVDLQVEQAKATLRQ